MIANPILPGFHADPSICRVPGEGGDDYYIATSTFEWWPGVRIHHSKDLVNWRHHSYAVTRTSQLDLNGHPDSAGVGVAVQVQLAGARDRIAVVSPVHQVL